PRFIHWKNQTVFRGGNGHVGIGMNAAGETVVAATGSDPATGPLVAVARLGAGAPVWTVAAHLNKPVLNGPAGAQIGRLVPGEELSPPAATSISAPAVDLLGNVYFLAAMRPNLGPARVALI